MRIKLFLLCLLSVLLWTGCNDKTQSDVNFQVQKKGNVLFDKEMLTEIYGPALTKSISQYGPVVPYVLPLGITDIEILPEGDINPGGESRQILVYGSFTSLRIRAYDAVNDDTLGEIVVSNMGSVGVGTIQIPAYYTTQLGAIRIVMFEFYDSATNLWELFHWESQKAVLTEEFNAWTDIEEDLPAIGGDFLIHISGEFPSNNNEYVFFRAVNYDEELISNNVVIMGENQKSVTIAISNNPSTTNSRIVYLQYRLSTETEWTPFEIHIQRPLDEERMFTITHNFPSVIPTEGGTYQINLEGEYTGTGNILVWAFDTYTTVEVSNKIYLNSFLATGYLTITQNGTEDRYVSLAYSLNNGETFSVITVVLQTSFVPDFEIPGTNVILAKHDAYALGLTGDLFMNFTDANGISSDYLAVLIYWEPGTDIKYQTGCNAYYEKPNASDKGRWRTPSYDEMKAFMLYYQQTDDPRGMDFHNYRYWINTNSYGGGGMSFYYQSPDVFFILTHKIELCRVRCVKDK